MQPKFDQFHEGYGAELLCPLCGSNYLHHVRVEVYERDEDQSRGLHVSVTDNNVVTNTDLDANPSMRRSGLSIHFACENCDAEPVLNISQHKGNTFVDLINVNET